MKSMHPSHLPQMRAQGLVIDEIPNEILIYDLDRHKAHCLNHTAALVWQNCDGNTSASEIAGRLSSKLNAPVKEEFVWLALQQLDRLHLLAHPVNVPAQIAGLSRRQMIRSLGLAAAVAVPLVTSIVAPTAAEASTCLGSGSVCSATIRCCSPFGCNGSPGTGRCF